MEKSVIDEAKEDLKLFRIELGIQNKIKDLVKEMKQLISDEDVKNLESSINKLKHTMSEKHYKKNEEDEKFLKTATEAAKNLKLKHELQEEIANAWKKHELFYTPENLKKLMTGVNALRELKQRSKQQGFGAFTTKDEERLREYAANVEDLKSKWEYKDKVEALLNAARKKQSYSKLVEALDFDEQKGCYVDKDLVKGCQEDADFLNPDNRIAALEEACKSIIREEVQKAIDDYKKAKVTKPPGPELLERALKRLRYTTHIEHLNNNLDHAMKKEEKRDLENALKRCTGNDKVDTNDIPLYSKALKQFQKMKNGIYKYKQQKRFDPNHS